MKPLPGSAPAHSPWMLTLWAAESQEQREWELPGPHGPGHCWEWECCAQRLPVGAFIWERVRAHRDAALFCACQGQELMLVAQLWHPLCCAPEWLLPSLQSRRLGQGDPCFHMPLLSQLWARLCPTFTEVAMDQLWVCSGGSQAHGSPLHATIGRRCLCCAAPSRRAP